MISGCPTAISDPETRLLQEFARDRVVVEAGALLGYSTIRFAQVSPKVVSIDRHSGYSGPTYRRYMSNLDRAGVRHKVIPIMGDAIEMLPHWAGDFTFIDLTGDCDLTSAALKASRSRLVGLHDFERSFCEGVAEAVMKSRLRPVARVDTLIILERP